MEVKTITNKPVILLATLSKPTQKDGHHHQGGDQTRNVLITSALSPTFKEFRSVLFDYHLKGMDLMADNVKEGKTAVATALSQLENLHSRRPNSFLLRVFFDAKADEISDIFSGGPSVNTRKLSFNTH